METDDVFERVLHAVTHQHLVRLNYHYLSRVVEPYALGRARDGKAVLVAWQLSGGSEAGPPFGWKSFSLSGVIGLVELTDQFAARRVLGLTPFMGQPIATCVPPSGRSS